MDTWDMSVLDESQMMFITKYEKLTKTTETEFNQPSKDVTNGIEFSASQSDYEIQTMEKVLSENEKSCREFIDKIDDVLQILSDLTTSYSDVTGRTNTLMRSCEDLLEQQQKIQSTMESLKDFLIPFNDIEEVSTSLGIPIDSRGAQIAHNNLDLTIDPRSPEFHNILKKLGHCQLNLKQHNSFKDFEMYQKILDQLQNRATSLVAKGMRELLENASKACTDVYIKAQIKGTGGYTNFIDQPLESAPIYQKFRGLGFRMRELNALLQMDQFMSENKNENYNDDDDNENNINYSLSVSQERATNDVKQVYVMIRNALLFPFIKEVVLSGLKLHEVQSKDTSSLSHHLCHGIRQAFASLLRIAQLEQHLYSSLFIVDKSASNSSIANMSQRSDNGSSNGYSNKLENNTSFSPKSSSREKFNNYYTEVVNIVETVVNTIIDYVRPLIIGESNIDELCRIIVTLNEDIRSQFVSINASKNLVELLIIHLNQVIFDAQERLSYCSENELRLTIQFFEPLPSQVAYPDILEKFKNGNSNGNGSSNGNHHPSADSIVSLDSNLNHNNSNNSNKNTDDSTESIDNISRTWYPPLRNTLSLLSKLYGILEMNVFDDFARRSVRSCVTVLTKASEQVKKRHVNMQVHGDLFLIRHLLLLREQLLPFEIKLQSVEKSLDFKNTRSAINNLALNPRNLMRFDNFNGILQLAREGLPSTMERQIDARQELDNVLRTACMSFKQNALKLLLNPITTFLTKVEAFIGDIPVSVSQSSSRSLAATKVTKDTQEDTPATGTAAAATTATTTTKKLIYSEDDDLQLPLDKKNSLKSQPFVKADRIKEVLEKSQQLCSETIPELREFLQLYVENQFARNVLLKPVTQEIETMKKKMDVIIASCVEPGSPKRVLDQLLYTVLSTSLSQLNQ